MNGAGLPPPPLAKALTPQEQSARYADCSCPRGGGWRPGARWAENGKERAMLVALKERMAGEKAAGEKAPGERTAGERSDVEREIADLPPHQRPPMRELGRRTEAAPTVFSRSSPATAGEGDHPKGGGGAGAQSAQSAAEASSGEEQGALVTTHRLGQRIVIAAACRQAAALGLAPGMALTQARVLVPGLEVRDAEPGKDAALLDRLALLAARRWTPRAAVSGPDGLWLDLDGVSHLFGGEQALCARIIAACARIGLTARIAVAGSLGAAHALARCRPGPVTICRGGDEAAALAPLPIGALRLDADVTGAAGRLGLDRIGDILAMPRAPLQRRFGATMLRRLDQALGRAPEPFDPIVPQDPPAVTLRFAEPIGTAEAIGQALDDAMGQLVGDLGKAGLAVRLLRFICTRVDNRREEVRIGTARATRDGGHLLRLLKARIETIDPGFGIDRIDLVAARVEPLGPVPVEGELAGSAAPPDLAELIDRLAGRLGPRRLYRMSALESDVPERSVRQVGPLAATDPWPDWPRPIRLLSPPERIHGVVALLPDLPPRRFTWRGRDYRVARADGPERIYGEWWRRRAEGQKVRDYFAVEDESGRRFWLFRKGDGVDSRTGDLSWWMQGMFG
jgi:protein ImuB